MSRPLAAIALVALPSLAGLPMSTVSLFPGDLHGIGSAAAFAAVAWGSAVGIIIAGLITEWAQPRAALRWSLLLAAVGLAAASAVHGVALALAIGGACAGLAGIPVAAAALLPRLWPDAPRRLYALQLATMSSAMIVFPVLADALHAPFHARGLGIAAPVFLACAIVFAIASFRLPPMASRPARDQEPAGKPSLALILALAATMGALHGGVDNTLFQWAPSFYAGSFGTAPFPPAWILSGFSASYVIGRLLLGILPDGVGERALLIVPGIAGGTLLLCALSSSSYQASAALYVAASLCYGLEYPALIGAIGRFAPRRLGAVLAASSAGSALIWAALTPLVGALAGTTSLRKALMMLPVGYIAFGALGALLVALRARAVPPPQAAPAKAA
jgi:MFS family permease